MIKANILFSSGSNANKTINLTVSPYFILYTFIGLLTILIDKNISIHK